MSAGRLSPRMREELRCLAVEEPDAWVTPIRACHPALLALVRRGLAEVDRSGRFNAYRITPRGRVAVQLDATRTS